jgi:hypothetical protein
MMKPPSERECKYPKLSSSPDVVTSCVQLMRENPFQVGKYLVLLFSRQKITEPGSSLFLITRSLGGQNQEILCM